MADEKDMKNKQKSDSQTHIKAENVKGKIEVPDTRERRDGPGGN